MSRAHIVWRNQFHQYEKDHIYTTRLEEPLDCYSAQELEQWVLLRRSADTVGWTRAEHQQSRVRYIKDDQVGVLFLIPGGRWLLVGHWNGSVNTYDLGIPDLQARPLGIITHDPWNETADVEIIAVHTHSPEQSRNLTFTMVSSQGFHEPEDDIDLLPLKYDIWEVILFPVTKRDW